MSEEPYILVYVGYAGSNRKEEPSLRLIFSNSQIVSVVCWTHNVNLVPVICVGWRKPSFLMKDRKDFFMIVDGEFLLREYH